MSFIALVECKFKGAIVTRFHCNSGGKYIGGAVQAIMVSIGIMLEISFPYFHESNKVTERFNCTVKQIVWTLLLSLTRSSSKSDVVKYLFLSGKAVHTAVYIKNRLLHRSLVGKSSADASPSSASAYEQVYGSQPSISHMRTFRS